jgi:hypothetical protein
MQVVLPEDVYHIEICRRDVMKRKICVKYKCAFGGNVEDALDETLTVLTQFLYYLSQNIKE